MSNDTIPVLFDTDIGSDIDDAVALAYLLAQPRCELLGVTTVTGDTGQRAALADIVCRAASRTDVPIHAGLPDVLLHGPGQPQVPQYAAVAHHDHHTNWPHSAIEFLRQTIRARPGQITLVAVGPLTNVAALFLADPEIPSLLKNVVLMGGVFTGGAGHGPGAREWNALVDPVATAITFRRAEGKLLAVGLDVTTRCRLWADECRRRFAAAGGALAVVAEMAEVWFKNAREITFHDPLAAAVVFEPDLCGYHHGQVRVVADEGPFAGLTRWEPKPEGPHTIATEIEPERFFAHYFHVVGPHPVNPFVVQK